MKTKQERLACWESMLLAAGGAVVEINFRGLGPVDVLGYEGAFEHPAFDPEHNDNAAFWKAKDELVMLHALLRDLWHEESALGEIAQRILGEHVAKEERETQ